MIILDTHNKSIQILSTVSGLHFTASWTEVVQSCQSFGNSETYKGNQGSTINGIVTVIDAPAKNTNVKTFSKQIEYLSCYNSTNTAASIIFQIDDNGTPYILGQFILDSGSNVSWNEDSQWKVLTKYGAAVTPSSNIGQPQAVDLTNSGGNVFIGTIPGLAAYSDKMQIVMRFLSAVDGPATVVINGFTSLAFKVFGNDPLNGPSTGAANNDIKAGQILVGVVDLVNNYMQLQAPTDNIQNDV